MIYTFPDYYSRFRCVAGDCEDTCCAGWQICIDHKTLHKYKKITGEYKKKIKGSIHWRKGTFRQKEGARCAFLNDDNLCDMHSVLGPENLCRTCRLYPRHIEEFEGVREISLSVSCPEVARMLLTMKQTVTLRSFEREGEEEYGDFDPFLYSAMMDARETIFQILQDRSHLLETRVLMMLGLAWDMQRRVGRNELFSCEEMFEKYRSGNVFPSAEKRRKKHESEERKRFAFMKVLFNNLYELELLKEDWHILLRETEDCLYNSDERMYHDIRKEFEMWLEDSSLEWEIKGEQLLVYFIFTYFCGAVYDGRIFAAAQMAASFVYLIKEMMMARWIKNEKDLNEEDITTIVYRFSRELEHSDENLRRMEKLLEREAEIWAD